MPFEIKIKNRIAKVEILEKHDSLYKVKIDDNTYNIDATKVENGVYSLIHQGKSINMEMIEGESSNRYVVNTRSNDYEIEIIDAKARYLAQNKDELNNEDTIISSPMPGKIVKIPVKKGTTVSKGDTLVIVSAMKMESEYKSPINGIVVNVFVRQDETIDSNQSLIEIEPTKKTQK